MKEKKVILTRDKSFYRSLITLALPIALQNLITFAVGFADNVMIGSLGDAAISGVYFANQIQTLLQFFSGGIEAAILVLGAQYWGKGDKKSINRIASIGIRMSAAVGVLLTLLCTILPKWVISLFTDEAQIIDTGANYLFILAFSFVLFCITQALIATARSAEAARIGLYVSFTSLIINVALNYLLIFGRLGLPALGVTGAAIATLTSRAVECIIMLLYTFVTDKRLRFRPSYLFSLDRELLRDFIRYGMPVLAGHLVWAVNILCGSSIMGHQSAEGVSAALSVANTMHNLAYVLMSGMSAAVGIIVGKTIGMGKEEKVKEYSYTTQIIFIILGLATGLSLFLLKAPFISLYGVSDEAKAFANSFINVISVTFIGTCYQSACLTGLVKSGGDISYVFKLDLVFVFLVNLPLGLIATRLGLAPWLVFGALKLDQLLKCAIAAVKINSFNWIKNLTRGGGEANSSKKASTDGE